MRKKKERVPTVVSIDGERYMSIADAAQVKGVVRSAIYFFHHTERQGLPSVLRFKEAGGLLWVTEKSLKKWSPRSYRHWRPENVRGVK